MEAKRVQKQPDQGTASHQVAAELTGPQVYLRLRPPQGATVATTYTVGKDGTELITTSTRHRLEKHFGFTFIFDRFVDQDEIYQRCVAPRINAEEGMTIMMYGTSGSGKTYTLLGDDKNVGIIPRALHQIFTNCRDRIQELPILKSIRGTITPLRVGAFENELSVRNSTLDLCPSLDNTTPIEGLGLDSATRHHPTEETVVFYITFVEIYNELVYDLLAMPSQRSEKLKVVYNKGEVFVDGLTSVFVTNYEDAIRLLRLGHQRSTFGSTNVNDRSSRSHCVFTLEMVKCNCSGLTTLSSFKFCDLAGSERVRTSGSTGQRFEETKNINASLMVLGRCLGAACSISRGTSKTTVMPYRESKLTLLLHAALLGKEKLVMIATVLPVDIFYEENQNVLTFAAIAKNIVFPEPEAKQQIFSNLMGSLNFSETAGRSHHHIEELELQNNWWYSQKVSVKRQLMRGFQELKDKADLCKTEIMAEHEHVNADLWRRREELKVQIDILTNRLAVLKAMMDSSCEENDE